MRRQKGLTLMELLIVIGIIAVLAGLLFPVFVTIRERARIVYCINNLKQVGNALHMYAQDYDGYAPPYANHVILTPIAEKVFLPNSDDPSLFEGAYIPYTKDRQIWFCPLDPLAGVDTRIPPEGDLWHYWNGYNHKATSYLIESVNAIRGIAPVRIDSPPNPKQVESLLARYTGDHVRYVHWERLGRINYAIDVHKKPSRPYESSVGIFLFFDGQVKAYKPY